MRKISSYRHPITWVVGDAPSSSVSWLYLFLLFTVLFPLWEVFVRFEVADFSLFSLPSHIATTLWQLVTSGELVEHGIASAKRVLPGLLIGTAVGFPLGIGLALFPHLASVSEKVMALLYATSKLSVFYVFIIWMGIYEAPKLGITIWITVLFQTTLSFFRCRALLYGRENIDKGMHEMILMAINMGVSRWQLYRDILVPLLLPQLFFGLFLSSSISWSLLALTEQTGTMRGFGFLIQEGHEMVEIELIFAATILLACCNLLSWGVIRLIEKQVLHWRQ
ncbi:ABC transporter permease subunit [Patescibacteria group bacterium]|nr:ABC transporter permease subunit [Patescibacteria group bacterium]